MSHVVSWYALGGSIEQGLAYGVLALGVYLTFRVLHFPDLTVDGSFPLGAAVAATLIVGGMPPIAATLIAFVAGMTAGAITGLMHTKMRIAGLLASILTMTALYSVNLRIMGRPNIPLLRQPTVFTNLSDWGFNHPLQALIVFAVLVCLVKLLIDWFLSTQIGLAIRATGDNSDMIRSLGVNTDNMIVLGLAFSNGLVALGGAMMAQYQGYADVGMGLGTIVTGLASVILGNALIRPSTVFRGTLGRGRRVRSCTGWRSILRSELGLPRPTCASSQRSSSSSRWRDRLSKSAWDRAKSLRTKSSTRSPLRPTALPPPASERKECEPCW